MEIKEDKTTSINVSQLTWKKLLNRKQLGETFDDVIIKLIEKENETQPNWMSIPKNPNKRMHIQKWKQT